MLTVQRISLDDDLDQIVADINAGQWDDANDVCAYNVQALRTYLSRQDTLFLTCYDNANPPAFMGMASGRIEIKPYDEEHWLYVDEVDVCVDQRQRGAGKAIMQHLLEIAEDNDCEELWLGTEVDNAPANALYRSLEPDEEEQFVGYTFETDD